MLAAWHRVVELARSDLYMAVSAVPCPFNLKFQHSAQWVCLLQMELSFWNMRRLMLGVNLQRCSQGHMLT